MTQVTTWFKGMKDATVVWLSPEENIANYTMSEDRPEILVQAIPFTERDPDDPPDSIPPGPVYALRFPRPIILEGLKGEFESRDMLFIRQDDIDMFKAARALQNVVLTGNPGVGKSWFQVRFLLFCTRPDIYKALSGEAKFPIDFRFSREPPEYIFRMVATESKGYVFDLVNMQVLPASQASLAKNRESTVLYEPGFDDARMAPLDGFEQGQCIMTVSPDVSRYEEFLKSTSGAAALVMPCHFAAELMAMGRVLSACFETTYATVSIEDKPVDPYTEDKVRERLRKYGAFVRLVLTRERSEYDEMQSKKLNSLAPEKLLAAFRTIELDDKTPSVNYVSTWLLKFDVARDTSGRVESFRRSNTWLEASNGNVIAKLREKLTEKSENDLVLCLLPLFQGGKLTRTTQEVTATFQLLVEAWVRRSVLFRAFAFWPGEDNDKVGDRKWEEFRPPTFFGEPHLGSVRFTDMVEKRLYKPADTLYPFVEMMWRQGDELFAVQATVSEKHPKSFDTFKKSWLKEHLGVSIDEVNTEPGAPTRIHLIFVLQPGIVNEKRTKPVARGFAWTPANATSTPELLRLREAGSIKFLIAKPDPKEGWQSHASIFDNEANLPTQEG